MTSATVPGLADDDVERAGRRATIPARLAMRRDGSTFATPANDWAGLRVYGESAKVLPRPRGRRARTLRMVSSTRSRSRPTSCARKRSTR